MLSYRLLARAVPVIFVGTSFFGWHIFGRMAGVQVEFLPGGRSSRSTTSLRPSGALVDEKTQKALDLRRSIKDSIAAQSSAEAIEDQSSTDSIEEQSSTEAVEEPNPFSFANTQAANIGIQHWQNLLSATAPGELVSQLEEKSVVVVPSPLPATPLPLPTVAPQRPLEVRSPLPTAAPSQQPRPPSQDCEFIYAKTTIDSGLLVDTTQPVDSAKQCGRKCQAHSECHSFAWHGYLEADGVEDARYSRKCFMFSDGHPKKVAHNMVTSGECPDLRWSCGGNLAIAEKTLQNHPALHDHLGGHEYFLRTIEVIKLFGRSRLENKTFLEIGYGLALAAVVMRGINTKIYATEPYPVPWTPKRHGPFYDELLKSTRDAVESGALQKPFDLDKVADFASRCGKEPEDVHVLQTTLEELDGIPDGSLDISYSLAVLEHISLVDESFSALARKMRIGGLSCHQIDMRDHGSFDRPWDFLLDDAMFEARVNLMELGRRHPYFGNRIRLSEFTAAAEKNGFQTVHLARNHIPASEEGLRYVEESIAKLRACNGCRYQNWTRDDLDQCTSNRMPMTGVFWCVRYLGEPPPEDDEKPPCGIDIWSRSDFKFFEEIVKPDKAGFKRVSGYSTSKAPKRAAGH